MTKQNLIAKFKGRVYRFALDVIGFVDQLSGEQTSRIVSDQLLRSTPSIGANVIEARPQRSPIFSSPVYQP